MDRRFSRDLVGKGGAVTGALSDRPLEHPWLLFEPVGDEDWILINPDSPGGRLVRGGRELLRSVFTRPALALAIACALGAGLLIFGSLVVWVDPWPTEWRFFAWLIGGSFEPGATLALLAAALFLVIGRSSGSCQLGGRIFPAVLALAGVIGAAVNLAALFASVSVTFPDDVATATELGGKASVVLGYLSPVVLAGLVTSLGLRLSWQAAAGSEEAEP